MNKRSLKIHPIIVAILLGCTIVMIQILLLHFYLYFKYHLNAWPWEGVPINYE